MDRPVHLLVEERVPHMALDARVAADSELAEHPGGLVDVERAHEGLLVRRRRSFDDPPSLVPHPHSLDDLWLLDGGVLGERDDAFRRVLDRAVEDLAPGHVHVPRVDLARTAGDAEAQVGLVTDDAHLLGRIEALLDPLHLLALGVPVEEYGPEQEVLELPEAHACLLGECRSGVAARDPGDLERKPAGDERVRAGLDRVALLLGEADPVARVLGPTDPDTRVALVLDLDPERRSLGDVLRRCSLRPDRLERPEVHPGEAELDERDRRPSPERADDLLDQRPGMRAAHDDDFPAGLDVDAALDEKARVLLDAWISHSSPLL